MELCRSVAVMFFRFCGMQIIYENVCRWHALQWFAYGFSLAHLIIAVVYREQKKTAISIGRCGLFIIYGLRLYTAAVSLRES